MALASHYTVGPRSQIGQGRTRWRVEEVQALAKTYLVVHHPIRGPLRWTKRLGIIPWFTRLPDRCGCCERAWPCRTAVQAERCIRAGDQMLAGERVDDLSVRAQPSGSEPGSRATPYSSRGRDRADAPTP